jgi:hypothetical protein
MLDIRYGLRGRQRVAWCGYYVVDVIMVMIALQSVRA